MSHLSEPRFVTALPPEAPRGGFYARRGPSPKEQLWEKLRQRPGVWAEVQRFPHDREQAARNKAHSIKKGADDIESASRTVDGERVVYARAVA